MTERLYYADARLRSFDARVLSCTPEGDVWAVTLSRTAFFPEAGGQGADRGELGGVAVLDVQERAGEPVHLCAGPLCPGEQVRGALDWPTRFARMQAHTAEHLVSGMAHARWGCENVGFHMADALVTLDLDRELTPAQVAELERGANESVWENLPVRTFFPSAEELKGLAYRSKKELSGPVRLVEIAGRDLCACCAPHVSATGELGLVRLTDAMRHRGGMRLTLLAGRNAYADAVGKTGAVRSLSRLLSAPQDALPPAVERLLGELNEARGELTRLHRERLARLADRLPRTAGSLCLFEDERAGRAALRELAGAGADRCGGVCAVFTGSDGEGWQYIIAGRHTNLRERAAAINAALDGRGGGSPALIQGAVAASRETIERFFADFEG